MGHVDALQPDDEPPFALGNLPPGEARLAVDANLFRAPAAPHAPGSGDFLATRSAAGVVALREFTGALAVGQQEPHVRVPPPGSRDAKCEAWGLSSSLGNHLGLSLQSCPVLLIGQQEQHVRMPAAQIAQGWR